MGIHEDHAKWQAKQLENKHKRHLANRAKFGEFPELKNLKKDLVFYEKKSRGHIFTYYTSIDTYTVFPDTGRSPYGGTLDGEEKKYKLKAEFFIFNIENELVGIRHVIDEEHYFRLEREDTMRQDEISRQPITQEQIDKRIKGEKYLPLDSKRAQLFIKCVFNAIGIDYKINKQYNYWGNIEK
jgi:hypothetical protein